MPEISDIPNPLYGFSEEYSYPVRLINPTITQVHFDLGELNEREKEHARAVACTGFYRLVWYAKEMKKRKCSYREAVVRVNKRTEV